MSGLASKLHEMETYLLHTMTGIQAGIVPTLNSLYCLLLIIFVLMFFYIYVVFAELSARGSDTASSDDKATSTMTVETITIGVGVIAALVVAIQPLFRMALQAQEWVKIRDKCKSTSVSNASKIIHDDSKYWFVHHDQLLNEIAWSIVGQPLVISLIVGIVTTYITGIYVAVVVPAINEHIDDFKNNLMNETSLL